MQLDEARLEAADLVVVLTDHADVDWELVERFAGKVFDTRNRVHGAGAERL